MDSRIMRLFACSYVWLMVVTAGLFIFPHHFAHAGGTPAWDTAEYAEELDDEDEYMLDSPHVASSQPQVCDPLESWNRGVFAFNRFMDKAILVPVAKGYRTAIPEWGRERVGDVLDNLSSPVTFVQALLQGDLEHALTTFWRFTLNTTFGLGGLFDFASMAGIPDRREDFGQTLGVYGISSGPYLMLPFIGPASVRDVVGRMGDAFTLPYHSWWEREGFVAYRSAEVIHVRSETLSLTDQLFSTSLDPYATVRSLYLQSRESAVKDR